ncbi:hhH-GPD superfamily base excision DNA repair protein [Hirsutella rhossiliensis]|uniref:DNA-(apurinic or apyrimidinic site) lyase n=1 Tax=Hirsutella rhossiliensis TaxID=111463 RepID=A0A9P8SJQ2_9HYPO|nr:hhH-GPD superfamily base excision DNA repair protein [Hirsutella rhossiliensis]KAH0963276.1 hhH-GPD superfamily base excision DNA repair protein [Hirsutella rhossiliensis]
MVIKGAPEWRKLPSFRWRKINGEWTSTLHGRILSLRQDHLHLHYRVTWPDPPPWPLTPSALNAEVQRGDDTEDLLRRYFSLDLDLGALYEQWSRADPNFGRRAPGFTGVRILSQDAWEALLCFICSSNNNISRISQMAHKLCKHYGPLIGHVGDEALHDFPTPDSLIGKEVESHLRELGFGYRAKYIAQTARVVALEKPALWLESLRNPEHRGPRDYEVPEGPRATYKEAHEALLSLAGVGPKVADCIAQRDYKFGKSKTKTFNKALYDAIGDHFRDIWGKYAGWAHSVLFAADLREFSNRTRKTVVKAEVKTEVKVEETEDGTALDVDRAVKRRRTRQRV